MKTNLLNKIDSVKSSSDYDLTVLHSKIDETSNKLLTIEKILLNLEKFSRK